MNLNSHQYSDEIALGLLFPDYFSWSNIELFNVNPFNIWKPLMKFDKKLYLLENIQKSEQTNDNCVQP